jgi:hypothetical protein
LEEQADGSPDAFALANQLRHGLWWQVPPAAPLVKSRVFVTTRGCKRKPSEDKFRFAERDYFRKNRR